MPPIIHDFKAINAALKRSNADDWWHPTKEPVQDITAARIACGTPGCNCSPILRMSCLRWTPYAP